MYILQKINVLIYILQINMIIIIPNSKTFSQSKRQGRHGLQRVCIINCQTKNDLYFKHVNIRHKK